MRFPDGFLWGTATSSHQVEGHNHLNDWHLWEQEPGRIRDGTRSGAAAGWWDGQAEADLARAAGLGQNAHRMSLEWSRIESSPGSFDPIALDRYRQILTEARRLGLKTMVTLNHFTLPQWAAERGAWLWADLPGRFEAYAGACTAALGDLVDYWATLNEPAVLSIAGYAVGMWPPGLKRLDAYFAAMANMLEAHARGANAVRKTRPGAQVGLVVNMPLFEAANPNNPLDRLAARAEDTFFNNILLRALTTGTLTFPLSIRTRTVPGLKGSCDFVGLNYYGRFAVQAGPGGETPISRHVQAPTTRTEWTDWGQACPKGLTAQLLRLSRLCVPLFVTENGLYDNTDTLRPDFIRQHIAAVADAIAQGADVRGYFLWSLVDNFEWAEGWSTHFGLFELDRQTGERRMRRSAEVYAAICRSNGQHVSRNTP